MRLFLVPFPQTKPHLNKKPGAVWTLNPNYDWLYSDSVMICDFFKKTSLSRGPLTPSVGFQSKNAEKLEFFYFCCCTPVKWTSPVVVACSIARIGKYSWRMKSLHQIKQVDDSVWRHSLSKMLTNPATPVTSSITHAALTLGHLAPLLWLLESFVTDWTRADLSLCTRKLSNRFLQTQPFPL